MSRSTPCFLLLCCALETNTFQQYYILYNINIKVVSQVFGIKVSFFMLAMGQRGEQKLNIEFKIYFIMGTLFIN